MDDLPIFDMCQIMTDYSICANMRIFTFCFSKIFRSVGYLLVFGIKKHLSVRIGAFLLFLYASVKSLKTINCW